MASKQKYYQHNCGNSLEISTLGGFKVLIDDRNLIDEFKSSIKIWELFKYLITFRDELLLPEKIIFSIWPDADYSDLNRALRALIFRLRKALNTGERDNGSIIVYSSGCYRLNAKNRCTLDVAEFEKTFHNSHSALKDNPAQATEMFKKLTELYKGDYLPETSEYDWLMPTRNHYRRLFLQSVSELSELLKIQQDYQGIFTVCEKALKYEMYEEEIHFRYIEALALSGKIQQAKNHYKYVEEIFEREMGVKLSNTLQQLYQVLFGEISRKKMDVTSIDENLREEFFSSSPMLCDRETFKILFNMEKRRSERNGQQAFLGVLTLSKLDYTLPNQKELKNGMEDLKQMLVTTLRKGDVITEWNESQFVLNLSVLNIEQANKALERIQKRFIILRKNSRLVLHSKVEDGLPGDNS